MTKNRIEGTSLEGAYDAFLSTSEDISDLELATVEDWLKMMIKQIKDRRKALKEKKDAGNGESVQTTVGKQ